MQVQNAHGIEFEVCALRMCFYVHCLFCFTALKRTGYFTDCTSCKKSYTSWKKKTPQLVWPRPLGSARKSHHAPNKQDVATITKIPLLAQIKHKLKFLLCAKLAASSLASLQVKQERPAGGRWWLTCKLTLLLLWRHSLYKKIFFLLKKKRTSTTGHKSSFILCSLTAWLLLNSSPCSSGPARSDVRGSTRKICAGVGRSHLLWAETG